MLFPSASHCRPLGPSSRARCTVPGVLRGATCRRQGLRTPMMCPTTSVTWRLHSMVGRAKTCARWGVVLDLEVHPEWGIPVVLNVLAQCLALGTHDAAAPPATLGIISAKTPAARQPQVGSSSCFRQLRAQGYGHVSPAGWSSSMLFAETSARASCLAPVRRAIPLPSPGDASSLVRGAKTRTRPAQLSISRPRRPGHSAEALGVIDARASKATAHGEAAHHALSGCRSAEPPACHLGAQHHPRAQPPRQGGRAHPI